MYAVGRVALWPTVKGGKQAESAGAFAECFGEAGGDGDKVGSVPIRLTSLEWW
jgi:hypothetical protein